MDADEREIRELLDTWWQATRSGDVDAVLDLMADDVVFLAPGQEPFGKVEFDLAARGQSATIEGNSDIEELVIADGWAWMRTRIEVTMTAGTGNPQRRDGYTLSILRKDPDGKWRMARDANLLA